ncbi:Ig-like domain-containing protein [Photobacterium sanguinicancri]|uniref:Ig-like domain-containing protein n=1 Tax=Photobacterium sanguinicancri TaxID=875932 RepID=UPI0026E17489|nr:cell surface protein [Photobacterium sanguinicancri]MDO6499088.1 cell surface protein [Photobacterium sanguinicancri]
MYKPCWMSVPLIVMLTACGSDDNSNSDTTPDPKVDKKSLTFVGNVYDGPIADATVSVYAGTQLLASGKTNADGKYVINASIKNSEFEKIKSHPITYKAIRDDIILHEYDGRSLEQAFNNKKNSALISNFSTVEYVLADTDKNDFVSSTEWDLYLTFDRNYTEPLIIRYGAGLKAIIDNSASLGGYKNTTLWLRALRDEEKWNNWHTQNTSQYKQAWDALFSDKWFLEQEKHRFKDIASWEVKYDDITTPDFTKPAIYNLSISGIPETASIGDKVFPTAHALFTNMTSKNVSSETVYAITPTDALENKGTYWEVKKAGYISIKAQYGDIITTETIAVDMGDTALTSITLSGVGKSVTVGDKITPTISANWSNGTVSDVTSLSEISYSPENALKFENGKFYIALAGDISLSASYMGETSTIKVTAQEAVLTGLRLGFNQREQLFNKQFQVSAEGIHENDYIIDFTNEATWISSDSTIVESLGNGLFIGKGVGTATITATVGENTVTQDFEVITELLDLSLNLPNNAISREETLQLTLNGEYSDGSVSVISEDIAWTTSNPEILTIDENGIAVGIIEGESVVTATYKEMVLEETIEVIAPKIIYSEPPFDLVARNGTMLLSEGGSYPYRFKFTRSNGKEYVFVAEKGGLDFEWSGFREAAIDESGIQIADTDEDKDLMRAVRAGDTKLKLQKVPVELQKIFAELGVDVSVGSSPQAVELSVNVADNADVYQWHKMARNTNIPEDQELIQAIKDENTLYRFWQAEDSKNGPLFVTEITSTGESDPQEVALPTEDFKMLRNQMQTTQYGYTFLLTANDHMSGVTREHKGYRYHLATGELTPVDMSFFRDNKVNLSSDAFYFTEAGNFLHLSSSYPNEVTVNLFDFETNTWAEQYKVYGEILQLPSSADEIAVLKRPSSDEYLTSPLLTIINLATLAVTEQELTYPGDSPFYCNIKQAISIAVRDELKNSGAGCLVSDAYNKNAQGYFLWDNIADLPKLHLFEHDDIPYRDDNYGVASVKSDGHVTFAAGRRNASEGVDIKKFEVAEIVTSEIDGSTIQQVASHIFDKSGKQMSGEYSTHKAIDGTQFTVTNPHVPGELIAIFGHGTAVNSADGTWESDKFIYPFPADDMAAYHLGDTVVLSNETEYARGFQGYWQLQLRKPAVDPIDPVDPVEPVEPTNPEPIPEPTPAQ